MPRQSAIATENNFKNGLVTEATGLNFPENACTETYDCVFEWDGSVTRRLGFEFEDGYITKPIDGTNCVKTTYLWKNALGSGDASILVLQVANKLYFYEINKDNSFSSGASTSTVTLTPVSGATGVELSEAQFSDGNGLLFVTHPCCEPMRISYDTGTHTATATNIIIKIRDFEGAIADTLAVNERPTSTLGGLNVSHAYNLYNQGWNTANLTIWDTAQTTMPSNADVMWRFKDPDNNFDAGNDTIARVIAGNTPAENGHFIMPLADQDRDAASGLTGVADSGTGSVRPGTSAFFAGRVFYSSINYFGYNSKIYFTQIIERPEQYGFCYQVNDPTAEDLFDLLPSDGGVISIPEAGTIYKLMAVPGGLCVFSEKGVWFITGSTGIGFTANDYTVQRIAEIPTLSASSFVSVSGYPCWWNSEGIYMMQAGGGQVGIQANTLVTRGDYPVVQPMTDQKIRSFFDDIPLNSKRHAKGIYHYKDRHIRWVYRSEDSTLLDEMYEYDRVLNFNLLTGAFYPWTISDSDVKVNSIVFSDLISGNVSTNNVIDGSDNVVDASGNQVITFSTTGSEEVPFDKYLVSYFDGTSKQYTFASKINADYLDWFQYDFVERSFDSYFITGFKLRGQGIKKFTNNLIRVFSNLTTPVSYYFQGIWDYATTGSGTGQWTTRQYVNHEETKYSNTSKRLKVRGQGLALQFKVESVPKKNFNIIGWSTFDSGNSVP